MMVSSEEKRVKRRPSHSPVLAYHQVEQRADFAWNLVPPGRFERQMGLLLDRGYRGVTLREAMTGGGSGEVAITFDDGLCGVVRHALPVLRRFGFRATLFVPTGWIGRTNRWETRLAGRRNRHATWDELAEARDAGWEIGSHGHTHNDLAILPGAALREEMERSRSLIESGLGVAPESIAYPFGSAGGRVVDEARRAGFLHGCLAVPDRSSGDPLRVGRFGVRRFDTSADLLAKVEGGPLEAWQIVKDRIAHFVSLGTPRIRQRIWKVESIC